jgi:multidrug efflux pump subunit AcrB
MESTRRQRILGWTLSVALSAFMIGGSAMGKFTEWPGKAEMFSKFGFSLPLMQRIGMVEIAVALLFLVPQTAFVATILLTAYLGGATVTHLRVGEPFYFPIVLGVVAWIAFSLRRPGVLALLRAN